MKPYERARFQNERAYREARRKAREWSELHSRSERSRYSPRMSPEQFRDYFDAYVSAATGQKARRQRGLRQAGPQVRKYLVRYNFVDAEVFAERYGRKLE